MKHLSKLILWLSLASAAFGQALNVTPTPIIIQPATVSSGGTVTSITVTTPTGLLVNTAQTATITSSGTFALTFGGSANQIPTSNGSGGLNWTSATLSTNGNTLTTGGGASWTDASGGITIAAAGTNQNINLSPSGTGYSVLGNTSNNTAGPTLVLSKMNGPNSSTQLWFKDTAFSTGYEASILSQDLGSFATALDFYVGGQSSGTSVPTFAMRISNAQRLLMGSTTDNANGLIQLVASTSSSGGLVFGNDSPQASIYRSAASTLTSPANWVFTGTSFAVQGGTITGGAGNMTIVAGTGASRTMAFQTTTSGSTATTALTLDASQNATFAGTVATTGATLASTAPTNGRGTWGLGTVRSGSGLAVSTTAGIQITVGGVTETLAVLTTNP